MMRSTERFLTTHTGSLPRPEYLLDLMFAREGGEAVDEAALAQAIDRATAGVIAEQVKAGMSIVGDGEMSKPSYATYIKDRLYGFGGTATTSYVFQDIEALPQTLGGTWLARLLCRGRAYDWAGAKEPT